MKMDPRVSYCQYMATANANAQTSVTAARVVSAEWPNVFANSTANTSKDLQRSHAIPLNS